MSLATVESEASAATKAADPRPFTKSQLKSFVERIERLEEEKAGISTDIRDVYNEAKTVGFDVKALRKVIALRKMEDDKRNDELNAFETYLIALDMQPNLPGLIKG